MDAISRTSMGPFFGGDRRKFRRERRPPVDRRKKKGMTQMEKGRQKSENEIFASCSFASLGLHPTLCEQLRERMGFQVPTQVQAKAIPLILSGRHVLVNAATGTGKTITYLAPIIHYLQKHEPRVERSHGTFGYIMGGENRSKEKARLRKGISVLVATPGRLLDHLKNTSSFLHAKLQWIIFDEADRILELGFGREIEEILDLLGSRRNKFHSKDITATECPRQNILLSATLNEKVNHLAKISLENPVTIGIDDKTLDTNPTTKKFKPVDSDIEDEEEHPNGFLSSSGGDYKLPELLVQRYVKVSCGSRLAVLLSILKNLFEKAASQKIVVFFSTCDSVDFHYSLLSEFQWPPNSPENSSQIVSYKTFRLHGNMQHEDRKTTFQAFKTETSAVLLSTDVAARGLDFPKVRCIIQYDSPGEATEYVHRVGRTARLGERGDSVLFLQPSEMDYLKDLEKHGVSLTEYPLLKVLEAFPLQGKKHPAKKFVSLDMHPWVSFLQKGLESFISAEPSMKKMAKDAFCSWVRAYTAHRGDLKRIFMVKKLHLGHVARNFGLKEQPSLVGKSHQMQMKKRKRDQKQKGLSNKRKVIKKM